MDGTGCSVMVIMEFVWWRLCVTLLTCSRAPENEASAAFLDRIFGLYAMGEPRLGSGKEDDAMERRCLAPDSDGMLKESSGDVTTKSQPVQTCSTPPSLPSFSSLWNGSLSRTHSTSIFLHLC